MLEEIMRKKPKRSRMVVDRDFSRGEKQARRKVPGGGRLEVPEKKRGSLKKRKREVKRNPVKP